MINVTNRYVSKFKFTCALSVVGVNMSKWTIVCCLTEIKLEYEITVSIFK